MSLKVTGNVKHNGEQYKPGDEIKKIKKEEAERLINLGVVEKPKPTPTGKKDNKE
jgi:hypothetical protein